MRLKPIELEIPLGVITSTTPRGTKGRYKDCEKIRFHDGLPQKLGGWILASMGTEDGAVVELQYANATETNAPNGRVRTANNYAAAATSLTLNSAVTLANNEPVWLFDETVGTTTASPVAGEFTLTAAGNITATAGNAVMIRYPTEFAVPALIVDGGEEGDTVLTLGQAVTKYTQAGTVVRVVLDSGSIFYTKLLNAVLVGATMITLQDALPEAADLTVAVQLFAAESAIVTPDPTPASSFSWVIRFLANSPVASTTLMLRSALPASGAGLTVQVRPFQATAADGAHSATTTLTIDPAAAFTTSAGGTFPDRLVLLPELEEEQVTYLGTARADHDWVSLDGERWCAVGTESKLYLVNNSTLFDITPIAATGSLSGPFDTVAGSRSINVTDTAHGRQMGDYVRYTGASAIAGLDLNDEFQVTTVVDADNYTITAPWPANATVNNGGGASVAFEYDLGAGLAENETESGWGTGLYGAGPAGIGQAGFGVQQKLRIWSLDNFGEDLLASPRGGALYHWDRTSGPSVRAVVVPEAPATIERMLVSPQARHVVALGAGFGSQASPGAEDKLLIRWSDQETFALWIPAGDNLAGDIRLDKGSGIIAAIESRQDILTATDVSLHAVNYIGGDFVFGLRHLGTMVGLCGPNAMVDSNGIMFAMTEGNFIAYDGVIRVLDCEVQTTVFAELVQEQTDKVFACEVSTFNEVWFFYNDTEYVKLNTTENAWDFGSLPRTAFHDWSPFLRKPYGFYAGLIFQHETGVNETNVYGTQQPMVSFIESGDVEIAEGEREVHVGAMIPDFDEMTGSVKLTIKGRGYPTRPQRQKGPFTILPTTERKALRFKSRQLSFKVQSDEIGDFWRMGSWRVEARPSTKRGG